MRASPQAPWSVLMFSLRWLARLCSVVSVGLLLVFVVGEGFNPARVALREWLLLWFFPLGVAVGLIVAWWREGLGGGVSVGSLLAFYALHGLLEGGVFPRGWAFILFAAPGGLFLASSILSASVQRGSARL